VKRRRGLGELKQTQKRGNLLDYFIEWNFGGEMRAPLIREKKNKAYQAKWNQGYFQRDRELNKSGSAHMG